MKGRDDRTNHANQMNPNNDAYWQARGYNERPDDWEDQVGQKGTAAGPPTPSRRSGDWEVTKLAGSPECAASSGHPLR